MTLSHLDAARTESARFATAARHAFRTARSTDPIPPETLTATADLSIRCALALMPFTAIAWLFIAH